MSRRGLGRAPAWVTGLLALVLILGPGRPIERPDQPDQYRVELEVPPVEAALWFVARYPQYFSSGELRLGSWLDQLEPRDRVFVLAMAQTLTWAWVEQELGRFEARDLQGIARESITAVRHKTLNQLELNAAHHAEIDDIDFGGFVGDQHFGAGVFARLVRGVSNCEGQNHLVALLLEAGLEPSPAWLPSIEVTMVGVPRHELVRLSGLPFDQPVFVDGWSNLPPFTLDPARPRAVPSLAELGESPPPVVPGFASREQRPADEYANGHWMPIELRPGRRAPTKRVSLQVRAPRLDRDSLAKMDPWRLYLFARVLHIYDDPRAAELYRFVLEHHCDPRPPRPFVCEASRALVERI